MPLWLRKGFLGTMHFWIAGKIGTAGKIGEPSGLTSQCLTQCPQRCPNTSLGWEKESSSHELGGKLVNLPGKYQAGSPGSTYSSIGQDCILLIRPTKAPPWPATSFHPWDPWKEWEPCPASLYSQPSTVPGPEEAPENVCWSHEWTDWLAFSSTNLGGWVSPREGKQNPERLDRWSGGMVLLCCTVPQSQGCRDGSLGFFTAPAGLQKRDEGARVWVELLPGQELCSRAKCCDKINSYDDSLNCIRLNQLTICWATSM